MTAAELQPLIDHSASFACRDILDPKFRSACELYAQVACIELVLELSRRGTKILQAPLDNSPGDATLPFAPASTQPCGEAAAEPFSEV